MMPGTTESFPLYTGDYMQRLDELEARHSAALAEAEKAQASRRMVDDSDLRQIGADFEALKAEAEAEATRVTLRAIGRKEWRDLKAKHPPRADGEPDVVKGDRLAGVNVDTVEDDLVYAALVEPKFGGRDAFDEWVNDVLSEGEFQTILLRAWRLVNVARVDPKSLRALPTPSEGASAR